MQDRFQNNHDEKSELEYLRARVAELESALESGADRVPAAGSHLNYEEIRVVADVAPVYLAHCNRELRYLFVNRAYAERLGLAPEQIIGKRIPEIVGEKAYQTFRHHVEAALNGVPVEFETEVPYDRIGSRFMHVSYVPDRDERGSVRGLVAAITDITRRKRVEEALREREGQFQLFIETAPAAIAMFDSNMRYLAVSRRFLEDFRLGDRDILGRSHYDVFPGLPDRWKEVHQRCLAGAVERVEEDSFEHPDGTLEWLKWELRPWYDGRGQVGGVVLACELITARRRADEALRESEAKFRALAETAPAFIWSTDQTGNVLYLNRQFIDFTGVDTRESAANKWYALLHPDDRKRYVRTFTRAVRKQAPFRARARFRRERDGEWRWIESYGRPLTDESGRFAGYVGISPDVTETVLGEEALKRSEARFRTAVSAISGLLWTNNAHGEMEGEQPGWAAFTGQTYEEYQGFGWSKAVHPNDAQPTIDAWNEAVAARRMFVFEHRVRRHDGVWRLFRIRALPLLDEQGGIREWVGVHTDITEERDLLNAVRASEQRLRIVTDKAKVGLVLVNRAHRYRFANQTYADILGLHSSDIVGLRVADVLAPVYEQQIRPRLERAFTTGTVTYELSVPQPHGTGERHYAVTYEPGTDTDGTPVVVVVIFEISDRVRAEEALRESEERFRTLANHISQFAWMADETGRIFWYNERWYEYTGTTLDEMQGSGWWRVHHPGHVERVTVHFRDCIERGEPWEDTFPLRGKDGKFRWFLSRALPIRDAAGKVVRWFGTNTDITQQREAEQQLRRANHDLEQFAYSASHDLQEPLRMVAIFSELLARRYSDTLDGQAADYLGYLIEGAKRTAQLVDDLLAYANSTHVRSGRIEAIEADHELQTALSRLAARIAETDAVITWDSLPTVRMERMHLQQLFQNLVGNALKYRKDAEAPRVRISATRDDGNWLFAVHDNGIGIEAKYHQKIFGLFKRLHGREKYPGTGLGLAICQKIVERYGGRIWVESKPAKGSTFYFTLPFPDAV
jgi:PAS domain S-box-containing protein